MANRKADSPSHLDGIFSALEKTRSLNDRNVGCDGKVPRGMLETHALNGGGGRSDKDNAKLLNAAGKVGVLA